jgi:hypothetical protein
MSLAHWNLAASMSVLLALSACRGAPSAPGVPYLGEAGVTPTVTASATPRGGATPAPPTRTPLPPLPTAATADITVCVHGCDFRTLAAAMSDPDTMDGDVVALLDPVHTEAGILIDKDLTIQGSGSESTVLQASTDAAEATERVMHVAQGASVTVRGLSIRHGHPGEAPFKGGGIWNEGTLRLLDTSVESNIAADGGGIWNQGELLLISSAIASNLADGAGEPEMECGTGGGINNGAGARLTLIDSRIADNRAAHKGGGLHVACNSQAILIATTVTGNAAEGDGGGIHLGQLANLSLRDSRVVDNRTQGVGAGIYLRGVMDYADSVLMGCRIAGPGDYRGRGEVTLLDQPDAVDTQCK